MTCYLKSRRSGEKYKIKHYFEWEYIKQEMLISKNTVMRVYSL